MNHATAIADDSLLLDDFRSADGHASSGARWSGFTDRVMGGISDLEAGYEDSDAGPVLRMRGRVRLENNGGFIQVRLPLGDERQPLDASAFAGFAVTLRGRPGSYYLHLRSNHTRRVWQYFAAPLPVSEEWRRVIVPFSAFEPRYLGESLDVRVLRSVAIVAYGEAFDADVEIARLALTTEAAVPPD